VSEARTRDSVRLRVIALSLASGLTISVAALALIPVASVSLFRARRLYAAAAAHVARLVLRFWGIRVVVHQDRAFPRTQTIYVSNHSSTLDLFVLVALALPNTRFFLSGFLRKHVPLGIIAHLMGTFFTVPQSRQAERVRIFQRADRLLRQTGESVYLSPEGERIATGEIGHFNKGAFHLATSLKAPIVPLYIRIPRDIDPGLGFDARPGTVHVHVMPVIDTSGWRTEQLHEHKERVRDMFIRWHRCLAAGAENPTAFGAAPDFRHGLPEVHDVESTGASGLPTTELAG
jgi:1-acyl-sn-glycerol-3-phosphate acyltransferase